MKSGELVTAIVMFALAGLLLIFAILHFLERGWLLNNAWIYASKKEREAMDKKPWYRQSAIVFSLLSAVFLVIGLSLVLQNNKLQLLEIPLLAAVLIYAVVSTRRINKADARQRSSGQPAQKQKTRKER